MEALKNLLFREPARIVAVVTALLALLVSFGVGVTLEQQDSIIQLVGHIVAILVIVLGGSEVTRSKVTPVNDPVLPVGSPVTTPAGAPAVVVPAP